MGNEIYKKTKDKMINQKPEIAFLGLGVMGAPMTANLVKKGYAVKAWNRTSDRPGVTIAQNAGAAIALSIQEAVTQADYIFICVSDVPDVQEVILGDQGVIKYAKENALIVDFSTIGTNAARDIATTLKQHHLRFLDAPISGGDIGAINGTLTIMVGGEQSDFDECKPLLAAMGKSVYYCGQAGNGQAVKMCNQVLASIHMVALCEAIEMAKIQGIDPSLMIEVCSTGAAGSWALSNLAPKIVDSDFNPGFMIKHILKDLRLVEEISQEGNHQLPGIELANHLFQIASKLDHGEAAKQGTQAMIRAYLQ